MSWVILGTGIIIGFILTLLMVGYAVAKSENGNTDL